MIDVADSSKVYYYHYDGLGSVVALSNSSGNSTLGTSCQSYEYSAYGRVWAEYPDFKANPYMFTGRRFDYETGLYYYRARYYNPYIGRFLQTDPIGYGNGINWYAYCGNNPLNRMDPSGCHDSEYHHIHFIMPAELIDLANLSQDAIPGEFMLWLTDMGVGDLLPEGWVVDSVYWADGSDTDLDVVFRWNKGYACDPYPEEEPDLAIETIEEIKVLTVGGIGMLDDRTLKNIMNPWFEDKLSEKRWVGGPVGWWYAMMNSVTTPFREQKLSWKYGSEIYDFSEVNYIGWGFAAAHYVSYMHVNIKFQFFNKHLAAFYNRCKYKHWAPDDTFWFKKGYELYPGLVPGIIWKY